MVMLIEMGTINIVKTKPISSSHVCWYIVAVLWLMFPLDACFQWSSDEGLNSTAVFILQVRRRSRSTVTVSVTVYSHGLAVTDLRSRTCGHGLAVTDLRSLTCSHGLAVTDCGLGLTDTDSHRLDVGSYQKKIMYNSIQFNSILLRTFIHFS